LAKPFLEFPSNEDFESEAKAMEEAIARLRSLPEWKDWISFNAQGMGHRVDSYRLAQIQMRAEKIKLERPIPLDLDLVAQLAHVPRSYLSQIGEGLYSVGQATPEQTARILDTIFRQYLGIHPQSGEENYQFAVEWSPHS